MNINVHIERLILDNVDIKPQQKKELKTAVESELKKQLVSQRIGSAMKSASNRRVVKGGTIAIENIRNSTNFGHQIGNAVYKGIGE